jgi:PAS domain S-box-containing protein
LSTRQQNLNDILESIIDLARLEFSKPIDVEECEEELAAIAAGINMLGEELQDKVVSRDYLDQLIQSINEMLFVLRPGRTIRSMNRAVSVLLGYSSPELVGHSFDELLVQDKPTAPTIGQYMTAKDGTLIPVVLSESSILNEDGSVFELIYVVRDIRDIKAVEQELTEVNEQLFQSGKLSALGELAAGVAHELNQPLNVINIIAGGLRRDLNDAKFDESHLAAQLNDISGQVKRMAEIIDHMRIFTRNADGVLNETLDASEICNSALMFFRAQSAAHGTEMVEELATDLPPIRGNALRLEQVVMNLLANARNSVEESGKSGRVSVKTFLGGGERGGEVGAVIIEISDNGPGVPKHLEQKIFEPFFTTKSPGQGTGLGLSISRRIVEEHQGRLSLTNRVGQGATFRIALPVSWAPETSTMG